MATADASTETDRQELWETVDEILQKRNSRFHVPIDRTDGTVIPYCRMGDQPDSDRDWKRKSTAVYPGREANLCDNCLRIWVDAGKPTPSAVALPLTARQRELVETAVEMGYFEWPRDADLIDVGAALGITNATANQHLRQALAEIVDDVPFDELETLTTRQREVLAVAVQEGMFEWPREMEYEDLAAAFDLATATVSQHLRVALRKVIEASALSTGQEPMAYTCPSPGDCEFETDDIEKFTSHLNSDHAGEYQDRAWPDTPAGRASRQPADEDADEDDEPAVGD